MKQTKAIPGETEGEWTFEETDVSVKEIWQQLSNVLNVLNDYLDAQGITQPYFESEDWAITSMRPINGYKILVEAVAIEDDPNSKIRVLIDEHGVCQTQKL